MTNFLLYNEYSEFFKEIWNVYNLLPFCENEVHVMPLEENQWNEGMSKNEVEILIRTFLKQASKAHSREDIWEALGFDGNPIELSYFLNRLANSDLIDVKLVSTEAGKKCYYR